MSYHFLLITIFTDCYFFTDYRFRSSGGAICHNSTGTANIIAPRIKMYVSTSTIGCLILRKTNCSIVLPSQKRDIPIMKNFPKNVVSSSCGNMKQTAATNTKKYMSLILAICMMALLAGCSLARSFFQSNNLQNCEWKTAKPRE